MENPILKSNEIFQLMDYSLSHKKLMIRATVINYETEDFYNIDITFISTDYIQIITILGSMLNSVGNRPFRNFVL